MLEFKKMQLSDIEEIRPFFNYTRNSACDNTVGGTFMWRDFFETEYTIFQDTLVVKTNYLNGVTAFPIPLGQNVGACLLEIEKYCENKKIPVIFCTATEEDLEEYRKYFKVEAVEEKNWCDYLYEPESLATLAGRHFSGQRNHINFFKREYADWRYEEMNRENALEVLHAFTDEFAQPDKNTAVFEEERNKVMEVLENYDVYRLKGGLIRIHDNEIVAFSIGEIVNQVLHVHIEKAKYGVRGAYQMMVKEYAAHNFTPELRFINREEDVGDEGLRESKMSYHPCMLLKKYTVKVIESNKK